MGKIKKILENELVGGTQSTDVYPVTSIKAVYDENNERLDHILNRRGTVNISTNYNDDHIAEVLTLSQAIAKVPSEDRVLGFSGKFLTSEGWVTYNFAGESVSDWLNTAKWNLVADSSTLAQQVGWSPYAEDSTGELPKAEKSAISQKAVTEPLLSVSAAMASAKTSLVFPNMAFIVDAGDRQGVLKKSDNYDCAIVKILEGSSFLQVSGGTPNYVGLYSSNKFTKANFIGVIHMSENLINLAEYPTAKYAIFNFKHGDNPDGITNLVINQDNAPIGDADARWMMVDTSSISGYPTIIKNYLYYVDSYGKNGQLRPSTSWDMLVVRILDGAKTFSIAGFTPVVPRFFTGMPFTPETELRPSGNTIPEGAKYYTAGLRKSDYPNGYSDIRVTQDVMYNKSNVEATIEDSVGQVRSIALEETRLTGIPYIWKGYYVQLSGTEELPNGTCYLKNDKWYCIEVPLTDGVTQLEIENYIVHYYCCYSDKPIPQTNANYLGASRDGLLKGTKYVILLGSYESNPNLDDYSFRSQVRVYQRYEQVYSIDNVLRDFTLTPIESSGIEEGKFITNRGEYKDNQAFVVESYLVGNWKEGAISARLSSTDDINILHFFGKEDNWLGCLFPASTTDDPPSQSLDNQRFNIPYGAYTIRVNHNKSSWSSINGVTKQEYFNIKQLSEDVKQLSEEKGNMKVHVYGITVPESSNLFYIRTSYNKTKDIILLYNTNGNGLVSPDSAYVGDKSLSDSALMSSTYLVSRHSDSTAPFLNSSIYWHLFAKHGYVIPIINNTVNMTERDVSAIWKDQLDRQYTIGKVTESYIYLLPVFTNTNEGEANRGWKTPNDTKPSHLTHVSGGTHTTEFNCTYYSTTQLRPIMKSYNRKMLVDGTEITKEGDYYCNEFKVSESQIGYDPATIDTWFPSPVLDDAQEMARFTWSYNFKGANCSVNTTVDVRRKIECQSYGACQQQFFLDKGTYKAMFLIPKLKPQNGIDPSKPFNSPSTLSTGLNYQRNSTYLIDENDPVDRQIGYLYDKSADDYLVGMAAGLSLITGDTVKEKRIQNIAIGTGNPHDRLGGFSPSNINKFYIAAVNTAPFADDGYNFPNTYFKEINYYVSYFDPAENVGQVYWYKDGNNYVIYAHCQTAQNRLAIHLPAFMDGLKVAVVEKTEGTTLLTDVIQNGTLFVNYTDASNYIVVKTV